MSAYPTPAAAPLTVADRLVVSLAYLLQDSEGAVIDSADESEPLQYIHGFGQIIPGLERCLYGMALGEVKDVIVEPGEAYGEYDPEAYELVSLEWFSGGDSLEEGMSVELEDDAGEVIEAHVAEIRNDGVLLDFNHPLAGETLYFQVKIADLRQATAEELEHGHVHGVDSHH